MTIIIIIIKLKEKLTKISNKLLKIVCQEVNLSIKA